MKWLVTCFEPFDHAHSNSSEMVWQELKKRDWGGECVFLGPLPVTFGDSWTVLKEFLKDADVDGVLALGQAESRAKISLECVGLNWIDARIPDNAGVRPTMAAITPAGPAALRSAIPWAELGENEFWQRSYSAGTYVCNFLLFRILEWAEAQGKLGGFVHIPLLQSQTEAQFIGLPRMRDSDAANAVARILDFLRRRS